MRAAIRTEEGLMDSLRRQVQVEETNPGPRGVVNPQLMGMVAVYEAKTMLAPSIYGLLERMLVLESDLIAPELARSPREGKARRLSKNLAASRAKTLNKFNQRFTNMPPIWTRALHNILELHELPNEAVRWDNPRQSVKVR